MNRRIVRIALLGAAAGAIPLTGSAHHSFASEFDRDQPFEIAGTVTEVVWTNPHGRVHVDVEENGEIVTYDLELPAVAALMRQGWSRNDLKPGDRVTATGHRARNRPHVGRATRISLDNGEAVFIGGTRGDDE